ncbi:2-oxo acid dehydrogenase subunit E2 [Bacillus infantis]|uniref:dihydrolipoamide acetyltransferase family protein n=1 Tax=Bacillus infantis TaxID=324767 RepID=UPI001CD7C22A|nr:dihydrolipoamide acetyltransferase family protein [Bacillus infantis]MCA1036835.1 2-oxo acid dehydrogenase subunit E2 [Bacillus infantis]
MEVKLHDIGEGMSEAEINCFLVKQGDFVRADEPLVEVQTDKMTAEIPAPRAGIVREFAVKPGETVEVGAVLLLLEPENSRQAAIEEGSQAGKQAKRILASPYTRKLARENDINIDDIEGSGPGGRVVDTDIFRMAGQGDVSAREKESGKIKKDPERPVAAHDSAISYSGRRKMTAEKMVQSLSLIPHCTHFEDVDVTELSVFREELKKQEKQVTMTAFYIKALSMALKRFPVFNSRLDEKAGLIHLLPEHHIGVAVNAEDGLIVPVIRNAEEKTIAEIAADLQNLTRKALDGRLLAKETAGGTFTVSNVGPLNGSTGATPIILHPQTSIISLHKTKKMPVVDKDDQIVIRSIMKLSMSFDHRIADGAAAVGFTNRFAELIENPKLMLLELV